VPSNVILARVGARRWICRIMATWAVISAAHAWIAGAPGFYLLRFLLGLAEAGFSPGMIYYLSLWFPASLRSRYTASYFVAIPLTNVIGGPLSATILRLDGIFGLHGWQWLFLVEALPALVLGIAVLFYLPDSPEEAKWLSPSERAAIAGALAREQSDGSRREHNLWAALSDVKVILLCVVYFSIVIGLYGIGYWLPLMVQAMGFANGEIPWIIAVPYAFAAAAMIAWGWFSDKSSRRSVHVALACLLSAAGFAAGALTGTPLLILIAMGFAAIGMCAALAPFWSMPSLFLSGSGAAAGVALINGLGNLGGFAGPYAVGWIKTETGSYTGGMILMASSMTFAAILVLVVGRMIETATKTATA
jgi:ACS family tartrate transporter-like MFS transporter